MAQQKIYIRRSECKKFKRTEIIFTQRKNGSHTHCGLEARSVLVIRQAGGQNSCYLQNFVS